MKELWEGWEDGDEEEEEKDLKQMKDSEGKIGSGSMVAEGKNRPSCRYETVNSMVYTAGWIISTSLFPTPPSCSNLSIV